MDENQRKAISMMDRSIGWLTIAKSKIKKQQTSKAVKLISAVMGELTDSVLVMVEIQGD